MYMCSVMFDDCAIYSARAVYFKLSLELVPCRVICNLHRLPDYYFLSLVVCSAKMLSVSLSGVFQQCEMAFSSTIPEIVPTIWDHHLSSSQHFRRFRAFVANKLGNFLL